MDREVVKSTNNKIYTNLSSSSSTRVVLLEPGIGDDPIRVNLLEIDLNSRNYILYQAISYTWGPPGDPNWIEINGQQECIRTNLWNCLKRIRSPKERRNLWVDAISISQTDLKEKSQQVSIIGDIFQKAKSVIVWLGEDIDPTQSLIENIEKLQHESGEDESKAQKFSILRALNRRYWRRRWIIQELIFSHHFEVQMGDRVIPTYQLSRIHSSDLSPIINQHYPEMPKNQRRCLYNNLDTLHSIDRARASRVVRFSESRIADFNAALDYRTSQNWAKIRNKPDDIGMRFVSSQHQLLGQVDPTSGIGRKRWKPDSIITYLEQFKDTECENPLDQIYAILSLAKNRSNQIPFNPDYTIDMSELILNTCKHMIKGNQYQEADLLEVLFRSLKFPTDELLIALKQFPNDKILNQSSVKKAVLLAFTRWEIFRLPGFKHITYDDSDPFKYAQGKYNFSNDFPLSRWFSIKWYNSSKQIEEYFEEMLDLLTARQEGDLDLIEGWELYCKRSDRTSISYDRWQVWKESIRTAWTVEESPSPFNSTDEDNIDQQADANNVVVQ